MSMTLDTLHPDIVADLKALERVGVKVIDPSPGLWGGEPKPGLVTVVYVCNCKLPLPRGAHSDTHHALYGPRIVQWPDECKHCHKIRMWCRREGHSYEAVGEELLDREHYTIYAD